jgi:hypothetical protein
MICLSLWQPWATAWVIGSKLNETRSWPAPQKCLGKTLLVHAAKRCVESELRELWAQLHWRGALYPHTASVSPLIKLAHALPFGAIIGCVDITACRPSESFTRDELDARRRDKGIKGLRDQGNVSPEAATPTGEDHVAVPPKRDTSPSSLRPSVPQSLDFSWCERQMGDFRSHRFGWTAANPRRFRTPIPYRGSQGLFNVADDLVATAIAEVSA